MHFCIKTDRKQKKRHRKKGHLVFLKHETTFFFFVKKIVVIIWTYLPGPYNHLGLYQAQSWCVSYTSPIRYRALPWIFLVFGTGPHFGFRCLFDDPNLGLASFRRHHHDVGDLGQCRRLPKSALKPNGSCLGSLGSLGNLGSLLADLENRCKTFFACTANFDDCRNFVVLSDRNFVASDQGVVLSTSV